MINLQKWQGINLKKESWNSNLKSIKIGCGWDTNSIGWADFDLDVMVVPKEGNFVFFNNMNAHGVHLSWDNRTWDWAGDDETMSLVLSEMDKEEYTIFVSIFEASQRNQSFALVDNAYVRVLDESNNQEIARFNITENGGSNSWLIVGQVKKVDWGNDIEFKAIGEYTNQDIESIVRQYGGNV